MNSCVVSELCRRARTPSNRRSCEITTVSYLKQSPTLLWAALFALLFNMAQAQDNAGGVVSNSQTLTVQRKVDELFERGEFDRAYFIYRNELAPIGDKYAQYMVGYMQLMGLGVKEDVVLASAWYRLAAERNYPEFVAVRDQLLESLEDEDLGRSDQAYVGLRQQYSDVVLMMALLRKDMNETGSMVTGSRLTGRSTSPVTIVDSRSGVGMSGDHSGSARTTNRTDKTTKVPFILVSFITKNRNIGIKLNNFAPRGLTLCSMGWCQKKTCPTHPWW